MAQAGMNNGTYKQLTLSKVFFSHSEFSFPNKRISVSQKMNKIRQLQKPRSLYLKQERVCSHKDRSIGPKETLSENTI